MLTSRAARRKWGPPLTRRFYQGDVLRVARALIGCVLVREEAGGVTAGRIVEVEAYGGERDPASHARSGRTARNAVMFERGGHAYVYFTYGMHYCLNVVTGEVGDASAVLIRALQPLAGIERMRRRRGVTELARLARGPGCVGQALALDRRHDGLDLTRSRLWIGGRRGGAVLPIARSPRIGIRRAQARRWRFFVPDSPYVSGPRRRVER
ncbi:MAG TPA: DNA-3-methyladenine glycosylase [Candidatus Sulfotelmatobacter sp.]|nr:DNA-3-methyladenine glycosylase [Candidatus Sulfotelmatobacter sp.]